MSTIVEKILREIAEGKIEVDDGDVTYIPCPIGTPLYLDVIERPISVSTSVTLS